MSDATTPELSPEARERLVRSKEPNRGRDATSPRGMGWQGWKDVLWRVWREVFDDQILVLAGSVAFFAMLAVFPLLIAVISLYGLWADPGDVVQIMPALSVALPRAARELLIEQMLEIARGSSTGLGIGLIVSVAFTLLSAAGGIEALISGVNVAYDERETRSFVRLRLIALKFTLAFILFVIVALGTIAVLPPLLDALGIGEVTSAIARGLRWPALALLMMLSLSVLYRHSPNRTPPKWRWVSSGAVLATAIWIIVSVALSAYVSRVGSFNETYGTLGGVMALLLWFYLTSLAILLGAELNAELEHQTALDSTVGPPKPLGERGAFVADTIGEARTPKP